MLARIEAVVNKIDRYAAIYVSGVAILFAMSMLIADALRRTIFQTPFQGAIDIVEFSMAFIIFPAFAYALITGAHVRMTIGLMRFPHRLRRWCEIFAYLCGTAFFAVVTFHSLPYFWESWLVKEIPMGPTPVPIWIAKAVMSIGLFMFFIIFLVRLIKWLQPALAEEEEKKKEELVAY